MKRTRARDIARLWSRLRQEDVDLFGPASTSLRESAAAELGVADVPIDELLRAMAIASPARASVDPVLVLTSPIPLPGALATRDVVRSMLVDATDSILVAGFDIRDGEFRDLLMRAGLRGVAVAVIADRARGGAWELKRDWPVGAAPLVATQDVEQAEGKRMPMHAKVLIADNERALVGSANFTWSGMQRNLEVGLLVEGGTVRQLTSLWHTLMERGLLERLT